MGIARGGHRRSEIFEGVDEIVWKREPPRGDGPDESFVLKAIGTAAWGSAEDLGPVVELALLEGSLILPQERGLEELRGVQGTTVLVRLDGYPRGEVGGYLVPRPDFWHPEGWRSDIRRVAMFLATIEGHIGNPFLREWKTSSNGQCRNLAAASCRDDRTVVSRDPSLLRICV